jgi:hypothetical protein
MLLERKNRYQHNVCSIVSDKTTGRLQAFSRGEAITVFNNCVDFWNGKEIVPITGKVRTDIKALVQ